MYTIDGRYLAATCLLLLLGFTARPLLAQPDLRGRVVDEGTGEGIVLAGVLIAGSDTGTACNAEGVFSLPLPSGRYTLRISALGYLSREVVLTHPVSEPLVVRLQPTILSVDEVLVTATGERVDDPAASHHLHATEDLLDRVPGADFIQRANFAWEPVIRGMSGGQVGLVIDGVKVIGACVDRMDPTSAYVEVENLEKLSLSKGGFDLTRASQIGGTINLVTQKPRFDVPFHARAELGYASAATLRLGRFVGGLSKGRTSVRGSFSYKKAGDFTPGGREALINSGYEKNNYKLDLAHRFGQGHQLTGSFLADNAWDIGYPVLLMDATLARARIYSLTHEWTPSAQPGLDLETRLYHNTVDHWMDDFERDVMQRRVMRGMNMPMYGKTRTSGGLSTLTLGHGHHRLGLTLDAYQTRSFGDMWMFSLFDNIPDMYLLNLGDILVRHGALALDFSMPVRPRLQVRFNGRFDYSYRDVHSDAAVAVLQGRWGEGQLDKTYAFAGASATFEYHAGAQTRLRMALAHVGRLPTHVENYGHYVYNYVDGYFYTGNPDLKPERSSQVEIGVERWAARYGVRAAAYANYIRNYIVGRNDAGLVGGSDTFRFRVYKNARAAMLVGWELSGVFRLIEGLELAGSASYTHGQNLEADEPMYLIPPLTSMLSLRLDRSRWSGEVEARMAMPQNRVARIVAQEDGTDGYLVLNLRGSTDLSPGITLKGGVENLLDTFYHQHLSLGNLPSQGRNLYLTLAYTL